MEEVQNGYHDDINEDEEEEEMIDPNKEAEIGIIEEITLINFMCHKHLNIKLGPQINFIVGPNGSGKSAVLVAISVCLGAKAGFTNRGSKLVDLIRSGSSSATIILKLRNRGKEAYRPTDFGKSIVIERKINREGANTYKVKDSTGKKTLATSFNEVDLIMEQFNIQVNNPVAILMQDTSREFLNKSGEKEKYKFFEMATQLKQMKEDYQQTQEYLEETEKQISKKKKLVSDMSIQLKHYEQEYREAAAIKNREEERDNYKKMMAWAQVKEAEASAKQARKVVDRAKEELAKFEKRGNNFEQETTKLRGEIENKNALLAELAQKLKEIGEEKSAIERKLQEKRKEKGKYQVSQKDHQKRLENLRGRYKKLAKHIEETKAKIERDTSAETEKRRQTIKRKREEYEKISQNFNQTKRQRTELEGKSETIMENSEQLRLEEKTKEESLNNLQKEIKNLENQKNNKMKLYGPETPNIIEAIKKEAKNFQKVPIGPSGMYIDVKDEKWATAIEACLTGRELRAYIVDNEAHDRKFFASMLKKYKYQPVPVNVQKFRDHPYRIPAEQLPDPRWTTVLNMIQAKHPVIVNSLIDQRKIEQKILIEDPKEAREIIFHRNPQNVKEAYTLQGDRIFVTNKVQNYVSNKQKRKYLGVNVEDRIKILREQSKKIEEEKERVLEEKKKIEKEKQDMKKELNEFKKILDKQQILMQNIEREINELENFKEDEPLDISELEENLQSLQKDIEAAESKCKETEMAAKAFDGEIETLNKELTEKRKKGEELGRESEKLRDSVTTSALQLQELAQQEQEQKQIRDQHEKRIREAEEKEDEEKKNFEESLEKAKKISPEEMPVTMTCNQIEKKIETLEAQIEKEKRGKKNLAEVTTQYKNADEKYRKVSTYLNKIEQLYNRGKKDVNLRWKYFHIYRQSLAKRTSHFFNSYLSQKNYSGQLIFDHENETLSMKVNLDRMRPAKEINGTQDTSQLSGGERSFSTVSFLLSLWSTMENPFRAMDEFDVFMDSVNRQISINLIISSSRQQKNRQFIFITPHDHSAIQSGADIRVIKMHPPSRGQSTITQEE